MTIASKPHIPFLWRIFLRFGSSSSCCVELEMNSIKNFNHDWKLEKMNSPETFWTSCILENRIRPWSEASLLFKSLTLVHLWALLKTSGSANYSFICFSSLEPAFRKKEFQNLQNSTNVFTLNAEHQNYKILVFFPVSPFLEILL